MIRVNQDHLNTGDRAAWLVVFPPALGDSILSLPIIDRIRAYDARIEIVVASLPYMQELLERVEGISGVFSHDELADNCGGRHFEWVIDLSGFEYHKKLGARGNFSNAIYRSFAQWDRIIAVSPEGECVVDDAIFELSSRDAEFLNRLPVWLHESASLLAYVLQDDPLRWLNERAVPTIQWSTPVPSRRSEVAAPARELVFLPCGTWERQKWPEEQWLSLADRLMRDGHEVTLVLGPLEHAGYARLQNNVHRTVVSSDLMALAGEIASGSLIIAHDCGPLHLAAAMGKPCVSIFGPSNPYKWFWFHNNRQVFIQTCDTYAKASAVKWKVDNNSKWEDWPGEGEVYAKVLELLAL